MNQRQMEEKIRQLESVLAGLKESVERGETYDDDYIPQESDNERDYTGINRKNIGTTVPSWIVDYYWIELVPKLEGKIQPYHRKEITPADIIRHLVYAAMLNPDTVLLNTYDEIKHLKD